MNPTERNHLIELLVLFTGFNRKYFERMTDEQIEKMYIERFEANG